MLKVRMVEEMEQLVESVKERGVLSPVLVRPMPDGSYQMVSGHRRKRAAELAVLPTVPCIVRELTDDEAIIIMVDSNLQREQVLPSEKAFAYKMKLDAMRRQQGERTDLTSVPPGQKLGKTSRELLADNSPDSNTQIQRYIRLTNLTPELLDMVDNSVLKEKDKLQMALRPAVELSYLSKDEQTTLLEIMESEDCTPSHDQAIRIRDLSEKGMLTPKSIADNGHSLTLQTVNWQTEGDGHFTAVASYSGSATSSYVKGYTVTADYAGTVSRINLNKIRYVAIFEGTALEPAAPEEPGNTSDPGLTDPADPTAPVDPTDPTDASTGEKNSVLPVVAVVVVVLLGGGVFYFIKRRR